MWISSWKILVAWNQTINGALFVTEDNLGGNGPPSDYIGYAIIQNGTVKKYIYNNTSEWYGAINSCHSSTININKRKPLKSTSKVMTIGDK